MKTKEEIIASMYTSYRNPDEDFGRCGCCHKPLITCMCNPDDVDDEWLEMEADREKYINSLPDEPDNA